MICIDVYFKRESETCYFSTCILHLSLLTIPWTEEPGWLQSLGLEESDTTEHARTHSIPAECMTLDCALNLDVYLTKQYSGKVGQEETKSKSWSKVEQKFVQKQRKQTTPLMAPTPPLCEWCYWKKKKKKRKVISGRMTLKFSKVMNGSCQQTWNSMK